MNGFVLPSAPEQLAGPVKAWSQPVVLPTYQPLPADKNPMFLERRVYQGSSGKVYPLPFTDRISEEKTADAWQAVHVENEYLRLMILPEIGGRIHVGLDKTNGYDFFYRQNVIKPALVGLAGPWISGGVEFNWPQHHRPSTFLPTDVQIEEHADGSRTIWLSEHEPMNRMKGMHGVCLHPGKAYIELKVRLYNRTPLVQTFLWWANVATRVHEHYQSFFPMDVSYVADHAKRAMSRFPLCQDHYYGVDYGLRGQEGVAEKDRPARFVPPGGYAANDLSWYANIPVPTSYMAMGSREDFFGGYDHAREAGLVHVANHHIAPGKKQWTWGNHEFGYAWDANLTDEDGPYIELMAGVYTDNQPDFSFLHPGETRTFSQFWYPIQKIGPAQKANLHAAISLRVKDNQAWIGVSPASQLPQANVRLEAKGKMLVELRQDLAPGKPLLRQVALPDGVTESDLQLNLSDRDGQLLISYQSLPGNNEMAEAATEPPLPEKITSIEELYLTGLHLEQYRHATRHPQTYWQEALQRESGDVRCNNAMGLWRLRRGEFTEAESHFRQAVQTLIRRNPNPYDGEPYYHWGLALRHLERIDEAYAAFYKATWNYAWQSAGFYALAELDCRRKDWQAAIEHLDRCLRVNVEHLGARDLKAVALRKLGRSEEAETLLRETLAMDALDFFARYLLGETLNCDTQVRLDLALNCAAAGLYVEAIQVLTPAPWQPGCGTAPLVRYYLGFLHEKLGETAAAMEQYTAAAAASPDYCFPSRQEETAILQAAMTANPKDSKAPCYLGNLLYDRKRYTDAIALWERSASLDGTFAVVWRNLGIGYYNVAKDAGKARDAYERAFQANPRDSRLLYERDQLWKRLGEPPARRLVELERHPELVRQRDDLSVELATLYNQVGRPEKALELIARRRFQPWEGGEGLALGQHVRTHLKLGQKAIKAGDAAEARRQFEAALTSPANLGEARHLLANCSDVHYWLGLACDALGDARAAENHWTIAANFTGDFQQMSVKTFSEMSYYQAMAMEKLGQKTEARQLFHDLLAYAEDLAEAEAKIDYFATSLPAMLLFEEDLQQRQHITALSLQGAAKLGLGHHAQAQALLRQVMGLDPNHAFAKELLGQLEGV